MTKAMKKNRNRKLTLRLLNLLFIFSLIFNQIVFAQDIESVKNLSKVKLQAVLTPPYVLGPGDGLIISDRTLKDAFGTTETYNVIISADGYITIPLPDGKQENILAAGSTLDELSAIVRELFGRTLKNPLVFVQINKYRPINLYIGGEIVKPGIYKIESGSTQEKGGSTTGIDTLGLSLTQVIQIAGGLKPRANITSIVVTRGTKLEKKNINLLALLKNGDISQDINLQPGDAISVSPTENPENQAQSNVALLGKLAYQDVPINIIGQLMGSGSYTLSNESTLVDAIGKAGGLSDVGTLKKVKLSRYEDDGVYRTHHINIHDLLSKGVRFDQIALRPNDTIEVEVSRGKVASKFFRETGKLLIPLVTAAAAGSFGGFVVQDNILDRVIRGSQSSLNGNSSQNANNPITVIGE